MAGDDFDRDVAVSMPMALPSSVTITTPRCTSEGVGWPQVGSAGDRVRYQRSNAVTSDSASSQSCNSPPGVNPRFWAR